jgi:hypothetical protein
MIHTREKKDKDDSGWREHKLGMVYNSNDIKSITRTNKYGKKEIQHKILKKEYTSYIGSALGFKKLFFESVCRNNYGLYNETVLISDGARWISNMKELLYPDATQILDFYHVSEKIWELGKLYFDNNSKKCEEWCTEICDKIEQSQYLDVKNEIIKKEKAVKNKKISPYLDKNIGIMDYKLYKEKGFCIGSGAIEGSNKNVVQSRLKLLGMRWNRDTAQAVAILRSKIESNRWDSDVVIPVREFYNLPNI